MGAGITVAQGLQRIEPDTAHFAFIGDSTFFHSGITGIINAVYNQSDIIVVILDNSTTAMTGNQPHPGMGITMMNTRPDKISIEKIVTAIGVSAIVKANPFDQKKSKEAVRSLMQMKGVRVLLFEAPCVNIKGSSAGDQRSVKVEIKSDKCTGCAACVRKLGCPAMSLADTKAVINSSLCTGCGLCIDLCPAGAMHVI